MAGHRAAWWWIDRWRKSTAYTDMSLAEQGAYRNLLDELWLRGGVLPDDDRAIAKASGDAVAWPSLKAKVMARFYKTKDGWRNETHDEVSGKTKFVKSQSEKGKKGAEARWRPHKEDSPANTPANSPANTPANSPANDRGNSPANSPQMAFRTPDPSPYSVRPDPTPETRRASGEDGSTPATDPPPPPAAGVSGVIPHDPKDPLHVQIVQRVTAMATADAAAEGREPTPEDVKAMLRTVSTTPRTGTYLTDLKGARREWLEQTLRTCDRLEEDLGDVPDLEGPEP